MIDGVVSSGRRPVVGTPRREQTSEQDQGADYAPIIPDWPASIVSVAARPKLSALTVKRTAFRRAARA
jgi:hypothetical protein